jgi:hypothetical protein
VSILKPRYIYSSNSDVHHKRVPFTTGKQLCRFISLGSLPGKSKPPESKTVYIQAIELEPISASSSGDLGEPSPYVELQAVTLEEQL